MVQLQLAPAACEGAHTPTIHHNMCPGARLHTIRTPPTYHTIRYPTELLTDWAQPPIGLSSSIKDYVGVCLSVQINFVAAPNRRCRIAPHLFWREGIHLPTTSYDLRQPTIRRLAKGRHNRLGPERPIYHTLNRFSAKNNQFLCRVGLNCWLISLVFHIPNLNLSSFARGEF